MRYTTVLFALALLGPASAEDLVEQTQHGKIRAKILVNDLEHPWGMAFLPDGRLLISERPGRLWAFDAQAKNRREITGLPLIEAYGQGGLLDVALHPQFKRNHLVYFSYSGPGEDGIGTEVARARLEGDRLQGLEVLFRLQPKSDTGYHFGSRLVFDAQGHLYITLGDRGDKQRAQRLNDHAGSVIRLKDDGSIPRDNPFVGQAGRRPEIFNYGHRNMQGAALHPASGELWTHEHGPQGGDELNVEIPGRNYGWPVITYGVNYGTGTPIGEGTEKPGMEQPLYYWVPSIAPSGMAFYTGGVFPGWQGNLLIGSLKFSLLTRLELDARKVVTEEHMFREQLGRIRDVRVGPDGYVYLLTDEGEGKLVRLEPVRE